MSIQDECEIKKKEGGVKIPYTQKEVKLMRALKREHGARKAKQIYHAMLNSKEHEKNFGARSKRERDGTRKAKKRKTKPQKTKKFKKPRKRKTRRRTKKRGCK